MITLVQKQKIIIEAIQGKKSHREIAREMGISRNTVKKYLKEYEQALKKLQTEDSKVIDKEEIIEDIVQKPVYKRNNPNKPKREKEKSFKSWINDYLTKPINQKLLLESLLKNLE
ncbi:MAG: helix-turn-helix domain-containing protein [Thermotogota bacterium]|nr:helix-turn-helix domain-containing protein [Thermotogota bacterium]